MLKQACIPFVESLTDKMIQEAHLANKKAAPKKEEVKAE